MWVASAYFSLETGAASDMGRVRDHNEDAFMARPDSGVWLVADGMGGHDAGDFASRTIAEEMLTIATPQSSGDLQSRFMEHLNAAHARIRKHAAELGGVTVGATMVGLLAYDAQYACIWSGDSRIYLMRDGQLIQQTQDHTEVRALLDYLGLPFEDACMKFHENTRAVRTASSEQVRRPINRDGMEQWKPYAAWLSPLKDALGPILDSYPKTPD